MDATLVDETSAISPMPRCFNTAGPCQDDIHYMLPPTRRLPTLERLIGQRSYFVLHAPRQVGKTTAMIALAQQLTASGQYAAALVSVEAGSAFGNDIAALTAFLNFWRQHGEPLFKSAAYHEIASHLVLMAFLHRVVNGGGTLEREYAIGRDRMDLCLRYGTVILGIELKVWRTSQADPLTKGLAQLDSYLARLGQDQGWLVIFDRRDNAPELVDRLQTTISETVTGKRITVIRA
jgi:hypothetical protein